MFEDHEVIDEEDALALEQFPDGLTSLPFHHLQVQFRLVLAILIRDEIRPVCILQHILITFQCY